MLAFLFLFNFIFVSTFSMENNDKEEKKENENIEKKIEIKKSDTSQDLSKILEKLSGSWKDVNLFQDEEQNNSIEKDIKYQLVNRLKKSISCLIEYTPTEIDEENGTPTLIILVHGQDAKDSFDFFDSNNPIFNAFKRYAQVLSTQKKSRVSILSYKWELSTIKDDGLGIYCLLKKYFKDFKFIFLGFDLGGLVVKHALKTIKEYKLEIDIEKVILLGTPVVELSDLEFKIGLEIPIFNLYSTGDLWQLTYNYNTVRKMSDILDYNNKIFDIRLQIDGKDPLREDLKKVAYKIPEILELLKKYKFHRDLDLSIFFNLSSFDNNLDKYRLLLAIRGERKYEDIPNYGLSEIIFSNGQKELFKNLFGRDIGEKSGYLEVFKKNFI